MAEVQRAQNAAQTTSRSARRRAGLFVHETAHAPALSPARIEVLLWLAERRSEILANFLTARRQLWPPGRSLSSRRSSDTEKPT
jgi:hypothetical protein